MTGKADRRAMDPAVTTNENGGEFCEHHTTFPKQTQVKIGGRVVGEVRAGTFSKYVNAARHMLKHPPAWAFDTATLDQAERAGARDVAITDRTTGTTWRATIADIRANGFTVNRGFGEQIALRLERWAVDGDEPKPEPKPTPKPEPKPQPTLADELAARRVKLRRLPSIRWWEP